MKKYGFVYIWYDRKRKMFYIGCRWGNINDGYICSSDRMRKSYKRRPKDFKRRILKSYILDRKQTLIEEYKYLSLIKSEELGKKYYNLNNHHFGHWSTDNNNLLTVGEKISLSHKKHENWGHWSIGKTHSEETKEKLREANKKQFQDEEQREMRRQKSLELWSDPEYRRINTENKKGKTQSKEQIQKRINSSKERWMNQPKRGVSRTEEDKMKISESMKKMIWINNGIINTRINKDLDIPAGFIKGRCNIIR